MMLDSYYIEPCEVRVSIGIDFNPNLSEYEHELLQGPGNQGIKMYLLCIVFILFHFIFCQSSELRGGASSQQLWLSLMMTETSEG